MERALDPTHIVLVRGVLAVWAAMVGLALSPSAAVPVGFAQTPAATRLVVGDGDAREEEAAGFQEDVEFLERQSRWLRQVIKRVRPSVVHIEAERQARTARYAYRTLEEAGSGIIITHRGRFFVLTNRHVVKDSPLEKIQIRLEDGTRLEAQAIWSDQSTDIALLEVAGGGLEPARLGNSDQVDIGDFVLAVGSPFGLSHSVTFGIISAKGRRDLELGDDGLRLQDFLQTDAAINPGNSGGPLLNVRGEVIGINTAIASASGGSEGIGFAIPINMAMRVAEQLLEKGRVDRAYLGVQLDSQFTAAKALELGLSQRRGAHVTGLTPGSPAERAGIREGDIILAFDGVAIEDDNHLVNQVGLTPIGKEVQVQIWRRGQSLSVPVRVEARSRYEPETVRQ
ncbi:MAG: serine protease [Pirellulaceae bacterium]|nr:MAG: serine protease [Pirellulaceae bacterium]GIW94271.1 MAG: serine protease [Pirellulaceae bacterium]